MQIVIEMNDEQYYEVCRGDSSTVFVSKNELINVIRNGKPLPKEHGRLIDADSITYDDIVNLLITRETIVRTPTVIEEYRGGTEDGYSN